MILNSWLISKLILGRDGNWRVERLFEFKFSITRALLQTSQYLTPVTLKRTSDCSKSVDIIIVVCHRQSRKKHENQNYLYLTKFDVIITIIGQYFNIGRMVYVARRKVVNNEPNRHATNSKFICAYVLNTIVLCLTIQKSE